MGLIVTLTSLAPAFAKDVVISETMTINEYQKLKELKQKTDEELKPFYLGTDVIGAGWTPTMSLLNYY